MSILQMFRKQECVTDLALAALLQFARFDTQEEKDSLFGALLMLESKGANVVENIKAIKSNDFLNEYLNFVFGDMTRKLTELQEGARFDDVTNHRKKIISTTKLYTNLPSWKLAHQQRTGHCTS